MASSRMPFQLKHEMADLQPTKMGEFMDGLQDQAGSSVDLHCRKMYLSGMRSSLQHQF